MSAICSLPSLMSFLQNTLNAIDMCKMLLDFSKDNLEERLKNGLAPDEYTKAWNSFLAARDAPKRDNDLKGAMRKKILSIQKEKHCSNYRVYTDLHLNPGNINSWLKNGDCTICTSRRSRMRSGPRMPACMISVTPTLCCHSKTGTTSKRCRRISDMPRQPSRWMCMGTYQTGCSGPARTEWRNISRVFRG